MGWHPRAKSWLFRPGACSQGSPRCGRAYGSTMEGVPDGAKLCPRTREKRRGLRPAHTPGRAPLPCRGDQVETLDCTGVDGLWLPRLSPQLPGLHMNMKYRATDLFTARLLGSPSILNGLYPAYIYVDSHIKVLLLAYAFRIEDLDQPSPTSATSGMGPTGMYLLWVGRHFLRVDAEIYRSVFRFPIGDLGTTT
jgi:hypothetical protein